ncbi:hypothetical protein D3C78_1289350 [compost metagenome]
MLDVGQVAIQAGERPRHAFHAHGVLERGSRQQLDTDVVGHHVGEVQAQLGVAVQSGLGARYARAQRADVNVAAVFIRINGCGTGTHDDVAGFESLGKRSDYGQGQQGSTEGFADHGRTPSRCSLSTGKHASGETGMPALIQLK